MTAAGAQNKGRERFRTTEGEGLRTTVSNGLRNGCVEGYRTTGRVAEHSEVDH